MKLSPHYYARNLVTSCLKDSKNIKQIVDNFWIQVLKNKHFSWRKRIIQEIDTAWRDLTGKQQVKILSAQELSDTEKQHVIKSLHKIVDQGADFEWGVKPHILGGLILTLNDHRFDLSTKGRLDSLYYNLIK